MKRTGPAGPVDALERMAPMQRRRFMKWMGAALAAPLVPPALRFAANAIVGGEAYAAGLEDSLPRYFIEIDLRDQWDLGHVMVAPGLATHGSLPRPPGDVAGPGQTALFFRPDELTRHEVNGTAVYLTDESRLLVDHLDTIAMVELCELTAGEIHGHEAGNPVRSPGRGAPGPGRGPMFNNDPAGGAKGNEPYHSSTPTPATLFNAWQKSIDPGTRNGFAFKGGSRPFTAYHYAAGLGATNELDRHYARQSLFDAFPNSVLDYNVLDRPEQAEAATRILERLDPRLLDRRGVSDAVVEGHGAALGETRGLLYRGEPRLVSLPLTDAEDMHWGAYVPAQVGDPNGLKAELWEQMAWTAKLVEADLCRSISLEFDWLDVHDTRTAYQLRAQTAQLVRPLVHLIERLKEVGLYDRTTIAIYTVDGGRSPDGASSGDQGKNTVILCGGGVRGGYYGDMSYDGRSYLYGAPDEATGVPRAGVTDNGSRLAAAPVWRTVMKAAGVPDEMAGQFPDVAGARPLSWLLRG